MVLRLGLQEESPGSKPSFKMANALSSSYRCASIGFRQMVPPLPTFGSHPSDFSSCFTASSTDEACLFVVGAPIAANVFHLLIRSERDSSAPPLCLTLAV